MPRPPRRRPADATPRPAPERDRAWLRAAALTHVQRFACSAERLRHVLRRRIDRSARRGETLAADLAPDVAGYIEALVTGLSADGLIDDEAFAKGVAASLSRKGQSRRGVVAGLRQRGLGAEDIDTAVAILVADAAAQGVDPELAAAVAYARRRRLGPWCTGDRKARRDKDLAALGRRGFGYALARRVIDGQDLAALEAGTEAD